MKSPHQSKYYKGTHKKTFLGDMSIKGGGACRLRKGGSKCLVFYEEEKNMCIHEEKDTYTLRM